MLGTDRFQPASRPAENGFVGRAKWLRRPWPKKSVHALVMGVSSGLQTVRSEPNFGPEAERMGRCRTVAGEATGAPEKTTRPLQRTLNLGSQRPALSGQSESEQARAQEQEARRSYRQKPIRYEVMVTHSAPANLDARPNLLKFSERAH
jgi:hypothetical protein